MWSVGVCSLLEPESEPPVLTGRGGFWGGALGCCVGLHYLEPPSLPAREGRKPQSLHPRTRLCTDVLTLTRWPRRTCAVTPSPQPLHLALFSSHRALIHKPVLPQAHELCDCQLPGSLLVPCNPIPFPKPQAPSP